MAVKINDTLALYRARRGVVRAGKQADMAKAVAALVPPAPPPAPSPVTAASPENGDAETEDGEQTAAGAPVSDKTAKKRG